MINGISEISASIQYSVFKSRERMFFSPFLADWSSRNKDWPPTWFSNYNLEYLILVVSHNEPLVKPAFVKLSNLQ